MEWEDEDVLAATQETALQALEADFKRGRAAALAAQARTAAAAAGQPQAAQPAAAAEQQAQQQPASAAPMRRRKLPAILTSSAPAAAAAGQPRAAAAGQPRAATGEPAGAGEAENVPPACFSGPLRYAFTGYEVDMLCQSLLERDTPVVGFDIEWRVTYQAGVPPRPVALIQLCYAEAAAASQAHVAPPQQAQQAEQQGAAAQYTCVLLHIHHSGLTPHLRQLLCSPHILKVGVGISGDGQKMYRDFGLEMQGLVCLSQHANARLVAAAAPAAPASADPSAPQQQPPVPALQPLMSAPHKWSLAGLVGHLLRLRLEKSQSVRCSNWEARPPLTREQLRYAATDAWASLRVHEVLSKMPVVAQPAAPAGPAPAGGFTVSAAAGPAAGIAAEPDWVPACATLRHLQPAKLAVYAALVQQGLSVQQVAAQRRIQEDSVEGYCAEAISAGLGYSWSRMGVPAPPLEHVAQVCSELLGRTLRWQPAPAVQLQQPPPVPAGSKRPPPCSPGSLAEAATAPPCCSDGDAQSGGGSGATGSCAGADVLARLQGAGHTLPALKQERFDNVSYGQLRLALAHLSRCNPELFE